MVQALDLATTVSKDKRVSQGGEGGGEEYALCCCRMYVRLAFLYLLTYGPVLHIIGEAKNFAIYHGVGAWRAAI